MEQTNKKGGTLYLILAVLLFIGTIVTFIPYKNIDDECMLGYKALCAFTPISSLIMIVVGIFLLYMRKIALKKS